MIIKTSKRDKAPHWSVVLFLMCIANVGVAQSIEGTQNGGGLLVKNYGSPHIPSSSTPLMKEFYFGFDVGDSSPNDHHIAAIRVFPGGGSTDLSPNAQAPHHEAPFGKIELMYQDKNPDDEFFYKVAHGSTVPGAGLSANSSPVLASGGILPRRCARYSTIGKNVTRK